MTNQLEDATPYNGGIRLTTVKYTGSGKPFGVDVFITVETTHEFTNLASDDEALNRQEEIAVQLTATVTDLIKQAASNLKGNTSQPNTQPQVQTQPQSQPFVQPQTTMPAFSPAPQQFNNPVVAAANGVMPPTANGWMSVPSRFGDGNIKFVSSSVYSSEQLKFDVAQWITAQGIDASLFDIWDERTGPKGAEAGVPIGSVFNIKVKKDNQHLVPDIFHRNAAGRGKFNNDGSIYPYWSKDFEGFLNVYGGKEKLAPASF